MIGQGLVVRDHNETPIRFIGVNSDVTDKVLAEKAMEADRVKAIANSKLATLGEMASGVAHEINNPLAILLSRITKIREFLDKQDYAKNQRPARIEDTIFRISKIIKGLKTFPATPTRIHFWLPRSRRSSKILLNSVVRSSARMISLKINLIRTFPSTVGPQISRF